MSGIDGVQRGAWESLSYSSITKTYWCCGTSVEGQYERSLFRELGIPFPNRKAKTK